jgi:hypothetical protein
MIGEAKLGLNNALTFLAHVDTFTEEGGILVEKEEGETGHEFLLASRKDLDHKLLFLVVVAEDFDRTPHVVLVLVDRGEGVGGLWSGLAKVDPLFNSLFFFPSVVASKSFNARKV